MLLVLDIPEIYDLERFQRSWSLLLTSSEDLFEQENTVFDRTFPS